MREIPVSRITDVVERLCIEANTHLPGDVKCAIEACRACEDGDIAVGVLDNIIENYHIADRECVPICQDTGMACVFLEIGQDVHLTGGDLREAVDEGVRRGYTNGFLRKSVVRDPVRRGNTGDNTPAVLYTEIVPGEQVKITLAPKGFGSENMSAIRMFKPSAGLQGIKDFILETVEAAGPNPCPPIVIGVGIGGTFSSPKITLGVREAAEEAVKNVVNEQIQKLTGSESLSEEIARQAENLRTEAKRAGEKLIAAAQEQRAKLLSLIHI